jgi:hypothetical protein
MMIKITKITPFLTIQKGVIFWLLKSSKIERVYLIKGWKNGFYINFGIHKLYNWFFSS